MFKRSEAIVVLAAVAGVVLSDAAHAQQIPDPASAPSARETEFDASLNVQYDSNIARSSREAAAARGLSLSDEIFTPGADLTLARPFGRQVLFLQSNFSYTFHRQDTLLDREGVNVLGGINGRLANCQMVVAGSYQRAQSDLADISSQIISNEIDTESVGANAICGRSIGLAPTFSVSETWRSFSAPDLVSQNDNSLSVSGGLAYRRPTLGVVTLFGSYVSTDFPNRPIAIASSTGAFGYEVYAVGLSYQRRLGGRIEGAASVSYTELDPNTPHSPGFKGVAFSVDASYHFNTRMTAHALMSRATTPSNRIGFLYSIDESYEVDLTYMMTPRLTLALSGVHKSQNYQQIPGFIIADLSNTRTDSVFATATYVLNRRISVSLNAGDEERTANFIGESYSSTRVGITFKATY